MHALACGGLESKADSQHTSQGRTESLTKPKRIEGSPLAGEACLGEGSLWFKEPDLVRAASRCLLYWSLGVSNATGLLCGSLACWGDCA